MGTPGPSGIPCPAQKDPGVGWEGGGRGGGEAGTKGERQGEGQGGKPWTEHPVGVGPPATVRTAAGHLQLCPGCKRLPAGSSGRNPGETRQLLQGNTKELQQEANIQEPEPGTETRETAALRSRGDHLLTPFHSRAASILNSVLLLILLAPATEVETEGASPTTQLLSGESL